MDGITKDIEESDKNKIKIEQLKDSIVSQNNLISFQDTLIDNLFNKIGFYKNMAEDDRKIRIQNEDFIKNLKIKNRNYRFQRNFFILLGIITTTLIIIK